MTEKETKARYALALFMKTDARISTFIKAKLGISLYFGFGNPYFKELLIDKKVHESIVKEIFELNSSNIAFLHDNIMTSNERKAFSKVRNSFVGMPKASIKLDKIHAHAIFIWFSELIAEKGFLLEYQNIVNELIADKRILDSAEKVYDAKVVSSLKPEPIDYSKYVKIPQQSVPAPPITETEQPKLEPESKVLNPNNLVPTNNMLKLKSQLKTHTEFLQVYEGLLTELYENDYTAGDVPKLVGVNTNAVLYFMEHAAKIETKKARDECIARIRLKAAKLIPVAKEKIYGWKHEGSQYVVDDETYKLITHWEEVMEIEKIISELPKKQIFPTNAMKVLKENSPTAVKYLFNYSELIMDLRSIFGLKNTQIANILNVSPSQLSGFLSSYYKGKVPPISYRSDVSSALDRGEVLCELSSYVFEWECEHLKSTQTINPMPTAKTKINEPQLSMFEPLPELPEIEEPVVTTFEQKVKAINSPHITKKDIEEFNGHDNLIDTNFEKDPEKEPSEFVRASVKSASNELNVRLEAEIINRFRDPERGKRIIEMLKSGLVGSKGVPDLGITSDDLKTLEELHEEQNARLNAFLESKRQEALRWLQPEPAPEPETPSTAKVVEEAMKNVLPEPVKTETPSENVYKRVGGVAVNLFSPCSFGPTLSTKENPFVNHETVRQAMSNQQSGFNYIPYGYAGPSPAPDIPANTTTNNLQKENYNMAVDERPYPPIGERFPRTPFPTNNNVRYMGSKLIIPKRYFTNKESEELIREYYSTIDYYNSTPNEASNNSLRVGFRLGVIFNSMDKNEKEKILNFIEAIEEEYPDAFKLSDILKGGV